MRDSVTAFEIVDFDGFYESVIDEAFNESALLIGKRFFRKTKKDMNSFKKHVIDNKLFLIPDEKFSMAEITKHLFSTSESKNAANYILLKNIDIIISNLSEEITYKIMSKLNDVDIVEMCYSVKDDDIVWLIKK